LSESGTTQSVYRTTVRVDAGLRAHPANLRGRTAEEQRASGGGAEAADGAYVSADHQGSVPRRFERAAALPEHQRLSCGAGAPDSFRAGCRAVVAAAIQGRRERLPGSADERDQLFFG